MDIVHHAFIGGAGFVALAAQQQELAGLGFLAGSVVPDLDVAFIAAGKRFYLKRHQGPTHSLPLAPLYAALIAGAFALQIGWQWTLFAGVLAGLAVHVLLDLFNTFGIQLAWPFTPRRMCLDAVFFIDSVAWALTLGFFAAVGLGASAVAAAIVYGLLFALYFAAKLALQRRVKARLGATFAIPSAWNPFGFFVLTQRPGAIDTAYYDAFTHRASRTQTIAAPTDEVMALAHRSAVFSDMHSILRALTVTACEQDAGGTRLVAHDLAVRNFGGKFGRTELRFDPQGRLSHEVADI